MHPVLFHLGPFTLHAYGLLMAIGFLAALLHWLALAQREHKDAPFCSDLLFWMMGAGVVGGRLAYVLADAGFYLRHPLRILRIDQGGLIFYGGVIGGLIAILIFARRRRTRLTWLLDFVASAAPLGHAFGRLGCFLNGCCFGRPHTGPLAVTFPQGSPVWFQQLQDGVVDPLATTCSPVHPVQLYEVGWNLALYLILLLTFRNRRRGGLVIGLYFILYPAGRLVMETFRGTERLFLGPLSAAQALSLALILAGIAILLLTRNSPKSADIT